MTRRHARLIAVAIAGTVLSVPIRAQAQEVEGANAVLPWAYVLNEPASGNADAPDPDEVVTVPGSSVSMPRSAINLTNGPPDWHPDSHPPMPELVAKGGGDGVVACGYCHLPNGQGKPENAQCGGAAVRVHRAADDGLAKRSTQDGRAADGPAGLHGADRPGRHRCAGSCVPRSTSHRSTSSRGFASWRPTWCPRHGSPAGSTRWSKAAGWSRSARAWSRRRRICIEPSCVMTPRVLSPTYPPAPSHEESASRPPATMAGRRPAPVCHGPQLRGLGPVPALAGRSPSYIARQLYDLQTGIRNGAWSDLMDATVANLTTEDIVNLAAYTASLEP